MNPEAGEPPAAVYRRYLEAGVLGFQRCAGCGAAVFYPRVVCPSCGGAGSRLADEFGTGVVYATTAVHRREGDPYNVVLVDLEEGSAFSCRPGASPQAVSPTGGSSHAVRRGHNGTS